MKIFVVLGLGQDSTRTRISPCHEVETSMRKNWKFWDGNRTRGSSQTLTLLPTLFIDNIIDLKS